MNDLEAKLRVMRDNEPPFDLSIKLPKTIDLEAFAPFFKMLDDLRARFGFTGGSTPPKASPADADTSTILTLLLVPAFFSIAIDIEQWIGRRFHKLVGQGAHRAPSGQAPQPAE